MARGVLAGHMARAQRKLPELAVLVDVVWEVVDARAPHSSRNPALSRLVRGRPIVIVMAKSDLASEDASLEWRRAYERQGLTAVSAGEDRPSAELARLLARATDKAAARSGRGSAASGGGEGARGEARGSRPLRALVAGIPNVGKSTLVNRLSGASPAAAGARPGMTRGEQWIRFPAFDLLDTPGILPPRIARGPRAWKLRALECVGDEAASAEEAALFLVSFLQSHAPRTLESRYELDDERVPAWEALERIGRRMGAMASGGRVDVERAARALIADFRRGRLGAHTLERPGDAAP